MAANFYPRPELAAQLAQRLLDAPPTSPSGSGLFLAAPRRTGKSTFLREDLRPALQARDALVIYVDLWQDRKADPGDVIVTAIRQVLASRQGALKRLAQASGIDGVTVAGVSFSLENVGLGTGVSLSTALTALSDEARQIVVLILDEAQHAITSEAGNDALFALKAARDELNSSEHFGLRIVATGSNRDKLAMLRGAKDQAFFGAPLIEFPALDQAYIQWFVDFLPYRDELDVAQVYQWFAEAAYRPEVLGAAADALQYDLTVKPGEYAAKLHALIVDQNRAADTELMRLVNSLTPLQSAVFRELATRGEDYAPFEKATIERYRESMKNLAPESTLVPDSANVQQALTALQDKGLVWRAARGAYALEDSQVAELMRDAGMIG